VVWCLLARLRARAEIELGAVKHVEVIRDANENVVCYSCADGLVPVV
jgi:hypothetical protein